MTNIKDKKPTPSTDAGGEKKAKWSSDPTIELYIQALERLEQIKDDGLDIREIDGNSLRLAFVHRDMPASAFIEYFINLCHNVNAEQNLQGINEFIANFDKYIENQND